MINWKVRIRNRNFWLALIPAVLLLLSSSLATQSLLIFLMVLLSILRLVLFPVWLLKLLLLNLTLFLQRS